VTSIEQARLVDAYVTNGRFDANPVASAQADFNAAQAEVDRLEKVEAALAAEIERFEAHLRHLRVTLYASMARGGLFQSRVPETHRTTLHGVDAPAQCQNGTDHSPGWSSWADALPLTEEANRSEPLEARVGSPVDSGFVRAWQEALAQLETDANAPLPQA
jgi:hypothetical protein